ncbi:MAG: iron-sulfur cluster assembly protein [Candidatus Freyarchaeota archaeon]|nr:iron-sulfur cluster assembly protein [Candidatus Freyrarchaeum guaymaensis]
MVKVDKEEVMRILKKLNDPEYPMSIVDMGIVTEDDVSIEEDKVTITFTPTSPVCPMGSIIGVIIKKVLEDKLGVRAEVKVRPGSHINEELINNMLNDKAKYDQVVKQLEQSGLLERCYVG